MAKTGYLLKSYTTWLIIIFFVLEVFGAPGVLIGGRRQIAPFDFNEYYANHFPEQRNAAITPRGRVVRQAINSPSIASQFASTAFDTITCSFRNRTWSVTYTISLGQEGLGFPISRVSGQCTAENLNFILQNITEPMLVSSDGREITINQIFSVPSPEAEAISQILIGCNFQLYLRYQRQFSGPERLVQSFPHICQISDTDECGFFELPCLINTDQYQGAAIFYYTIYYLAMFTAFILYAMYLLFTSSSRNRNFRNLQNQMAASHMLDNEQGFGSSRLLSDVPDQQLDAKLRQIGELEGHLNAGTVDQFVSAWNAYPSSSGQFSNRFKTAGAQETAKVTYSPNIHYSLPPKQKKLHNAKHHHPPSHTHTTYPFNPQSTGTFSTEGKLTNLPQLTPDNLSPAQFQQPNLPNWEDPNINVNNDMYLSSEED